MATLPIIRKGDKTSHGGTVLEGINNYLVDGIPASGKGHMVECPQCKGTFPIAEGVTSFNVGGILVAVEGMRTTCGATLIASQSNRRIEYTGGAGAPSSSSSSAAVSATGSSVTTAAGAASASDSSPSSDAPGKPDEQTLLEHAEANASIHGLPYFIEAPDGSTHSGVTGEDGLLPRIYTDSETEYVVYWGDEALAKQHEVEA